VYEEFERRIELPRGTINKVVASSGTMSAWAQMERGEISVDEFGLKFSDECSAEVCLCYACAVWVIKIVILIEPRAGDWVQFTIYLLFVLLVLE
jgi:hypothetical protein